MVECQDWTKTNNRKEEYKRRETWPHVGYSISHLHLGIGKIKINPQPVGK